MDKRKPMHIPETMYEGFGITKGDNDIINIDKVKPLRKLVVLVYWNRMTQQANTTS